MIRGSAALFPELVEAFDLRSVSQKPKTPGVTTFNSPVVTQQCLGRDHFRFTPEHVEWFLERGCEAIHPELNPGDVVFWDSRTAHTAAAPEEGRPRMAVCTYTSPFLSFLSSSTDHICDPDACYKPAKDISPECLKLRQEAFNKGYCTTHDPITGIFKENSDADWNILFPYGRPQLTERQLQYAGMVPY